MRRRGPYGGAVLFAVMLPFTGCSTAGRPAPDPNPAGAIAQAPPRPAPAATPSSLAGGAAAVPSEVQGARAVDSPAPAVNAAAAGAPTTQPKPDFENDPKLLQQQLTRREVELARVRAEAASARDREQDAHREIERLRERANQAEAAARDAAGSAGGASEAQLGGGSPQLLATLRQRLIAEQQRVARLERDLERLRQETSAGPFENGLQKELDAAHKEIADLKATLEVERQARHDLAARYERLQAQLRAADEARMQSLTDIQREEIAALKLRQERAVADIERDLVLSRQREAELGEALTATQGKDSLPLATTVSELRSENSALQARLDGEHQRNRDLAAKLDVAMRVTDLIFRLQAGGPAQPAEVAPVAAFPNLERSLSDRPLSGAAVEISEGTVEASTEPAAAGDAPPSDEAPSADPVVGPNGEWIPSDGN